MNKRKAIQFAAGAVLVAVGAAALSAYMGDYFSRDAGPDTFTGQAAPRADARAASENDGPGNPAIRLASAQSESSTDGADDRAGGSSRRSPQPADARRAGSNGLSAGNSAAPPNRPLSKDNSAGTSAGDSPSSSKKTGEQRGAKSTASAGERGAASENSKDAPGDKPGGSRREGSRVRAASKAADAPVASGRGDDPVLPNCLVEVIQDVRVSAGEAGLLNEINVREGDTIKPGDVLGSIDKRDPQLRKRIKTKEYETARAEADTDVEKRFAVASYEFALAGHRKKEEANELSRGTFTEIEMFESMLGVKKTQLQIEQADIKHNIAELTADSKQLEIEAADLSMDHRTMTSRLEGEGKVIEILKRRGEWVPLGEPVFHIVQLDRLRVKGNLKATMYNRRDVVGRPVTVTLETSSGQEDFKGELVFANYLIDGQGDYEVFAEIENKLDASGDWVLSGGMNASMTIHLK